MGGFSAQTAGKRRRRVVWTVRREDRRLRQDIPNNIGAVDNLYTLDAGQAWGPAAVDDTWGFHERRLPAAIAALINPAQPLDALTWLTVLVPFVASRFVRHPEFHSRMTERFAAAGFVGEHAPTTTNSNINRLMELQRLQSQVAASHWGVFHAGGTGPRFISNDLGLSLAGTSIPGTRNAWLVPLDSENVLVISPRKRAIVMWHAPIGWKVPVERRTASPYDIRHINFNTAKTAHSFLIASKKDDLEAVCNSWPDPFPDGSWMEDGWLSTSAEKRANEHAVRALLLIASAPYSPAGVSISPWECGASQQGPNAFLDLSWTGIGHAS